MMRLAKAASNGCPEDGQLTHDDHDARKLPAGLLRISMIHIDNVYIYTIYVLICGDMCDTRMAFVL